MYYIYRKDDGTFAGSGVSAIDNDDYGSTQAEPPAYDHGIPAWDGTAWKIVNVNAKSVSPAQIRLALVQFGIPLSVIDEAIADNETAKIKWEYATEILRDSEMLNEVAGQLGLTQQEIDQIFAMARWL